MTDLNTVWNSLRSGLKSVFGAKRTWTGRQKRLDRSKMTQSQLRSTNFTNIAGSIVAQFVPIGDHTRNVWCSAFEPSQRQRNGIECCADRFGPSRSARCCAGTGGRSGATEYNFRHGF